MRTDSELRSLLLYRRRALAAYEAWERHHPYRSALDPFAQLDAIRALLPPEAVKPRANDDRYAGIRRMHERLSVLGTGR